MCHDLPTFKPSSTFEIHNVGASIVGEGFGLQEARHCPVLDSMRRGSESEILPMAGFVNTPTIMSSEEGDVNGELEGEMWRELHIAFVCNQPRVVYFTSCRDVMQSLEASI